MGGMKITYQQVQNMVENILEEKEYQPNEWESDFMDDILAREEDLTEKQSACLNKIYEKATDLEWMRPKERYR
jgi:hypothetical protein